MTSHNAFGLASDFLVCGLPLGLASNFRFEICLSWGARPPRRGTNHLYLFVFCDLAFGAFPSDFGFNASDFVFYLVLVICLLVLCIPFGFQISESGFTLASSLLHIFNYHSACSATTITNTGGAIPGIILFKYINKRYNNPGAAGT